MLTRSFTSLRSCTGYMVTLLLSSVCLCVDVAAQTPLVVSTSHVAIPHTGPYGAPWQSSVSNRGDFVLFDFKTSGMYQFPANGGPQITLGAPNQIAGGFTDSGIAIDPRNNNLYLDNNYNGGLLEFPFNAKTGAWDLPSKVVANGLSGNLGGSCGGYFQSAGLAINDNGVMAVATENGCGVEIFTVPIDASGTFGVATPIVANLKARAKTVAIDDLGNILYTEDAGYPGVLFVPAGTTGLTDDSKVLGIFNDPKVNSVQGVTVDTNGNLYVADANVGEYLVPLESGTPNPAHAVLLSPAPASGGPSMDAARGVLFVPTSGFNKITDVIKIYLNQLDLGASAIGIAGATPATVTYYFTGTVTPDSFVIGQDGTPGDFALGDLSGCGITPILDKDGKPVPDKNGKPTHKTTPYSANATCSLPITFTPHSVADISATLLMLDASGSTLNTTVLHGIGQGSQVMVSPATESVIGSAIQAPSQVAADAMGNVYVADSGAGKVLVYAKGAGSKTAPVGIGTGLVAPTGVAVDSTGNVFIADSGQVFELPYGPAGLTAATQVTLKGGLGTNLKLAADGRGGVFVADPDNQRVLRLKNLVSGLGATSISGLSQMSAIAADGSGDLFVASGQNLIEFSSLDTFTTVLSSLPAGTNGLAVDSSGAVYVTATGGTIRIPNESGILTLADRISIAVGVTHPTSVAVDSVGNAYVTDGSAGNVDFVNANGFLNFGTLSNPTAQQSGGITIVNDGNAPLSITGFSHTADYSETASTCVGAPISVGSTCTATITFNPGPGDQGSLVAQLLVQSDAGNTPIGINVIGVGASLAASTSTITVTKPTVTKAPVVVTVTSTSGAAPVPTGNVTLTVTGNGYKPLIITQPLTGGPLTFNATELRTGSYTFTVSYGGDRVYGTSTASATAAVAPGTLLLIQPAASAVPTYVLASGTGAQPAYDQSDFPFDYSYPLTVKAADGAALIGVPVFDAGGRQLGTDYGTVSYVVASGAPACSATKVNADGTAPLTTKCFTIDTSNNQIPNIMTAYTVTPVYAGNSDPDYAPVSGTPVTLIALRNPMVTITSDVPSLSVPVGSAATANLTLTSLLGYGTVGATSNLNNYSLPLELACNSLPAHASCSFSYPIPDPSDPTSVAVTVSTPGKVIMTINTNVPVGTVASGLRQNPIAFAAVFGLSLIGLGFCRRKTLGASLLTVVCLLVFSGATLGLSACSSAQIGAAPVLTTPKGTYQVSVTAKQVGSKTVPGSKTGTTQVVQGNGNLMSLPFTMSVVVQ